MDNTDNNSSLICSATSLPGCVNPPNCNATALVDTAANLTILAAGAQSDRAKIQSQPKAVVQPKGNWLLTTENLLLLLNKLPIEARSAHRAPVISHYLVSVATLADAGCELFFIKQDVKSL